jgi:hypothetical protein
MAQLLAVLSWIHHSSSISSKLTNKTETLLQHFWKIGRESVFRSMMMFKKKVICTGKSHKQFDLDPYYIVSNLEVTFVMFKPLYFYVYFSFGLLLVFVSKFCFPLIL